MRLIYKQTIVDRMWRALEDARQSFLGEPELSNPIAEHRKAVGDQLLANEARAGTPVPCPRCKGRITLRPCMRCGGDGVVESVGPDVGAEAAALRPHREGGSE